MTRSITLKKRVDEDWNPILDENGQEIMDIIKEEEIEDEYTVEQEIADKEQALLTMYEELQRLRSL